MTWPFYTRECRKEINDVLKEGGSLSSYRANKAFGLGPREGSKVWALEKQIEKQFGARYAIACNSGTAALHMALGALDLRGKEVITTPNTFSATVSAILLAGGLPVFADVDPSIFCITPETVKPYVNKKTAAILPVHLFGYFQDLSGFQRFGVPIIEDACQAVGAYRGSVYAGTYGMAGAYSFNGTKNVPAGEGGALVTNDIKIAERARLLLNHGENYGQEYVGVNYRMHELVAILARHGLEDLRKRNVRRMLAASCVHWNLRRNLPSSFTANMLPPRHDTGEHAYYVLPFCVPAKRARFVAACQRRGLAVTGGYITPPLHHYRAFRRYARRALPVVDELSFKRLCLISDLTPDKSLRYASRVARGIVECLVEVYDE